MLCLDFGLNVFFMFCCLLYFLAFTCSGSRRDMRSVNHTYTKHLSNTHILTHIQYAYIPYTHIPYTHILMHIYPKNTYPIHTYLCTYTLYTHTYAHIPYTHTAAQMCITMAVVRGGPSWTNTILLSHFRTLALGSESTAARTDNTLLHCFLTPGPQGTL